MIHADEFPIPPMGWKPRPHQQALWDYLDDGGKRAVAIWHRRAGKDEILLHRMAVAALQRPASYWYCLPQYDQCRKAIWTSVNPHTGKRRIDECIPHEIRESTNESEMFIRLVNTVDGGSGSTIQCIGSDNYSTTVGASTAGIVFSEFALANPSVWAYYQPILQENDGWAAFVSTPRGRNHAFSMYQHAQRTPGWFSEILTAEDTGALSPEALAETLAEMQSFYGVDVGRNVFLQEYMCSWNAASLGAFYAVECADVRNEGRITEIEALPDQYMHRAWDLGVRDDTAIWWFQACGGQLFLHDFYAASGVGLEHFAAVIEQKEAEHGWLSGHDYVPHDAKIKEWGSGRTRVETMQAMGLNPILVPLAGLEDGRNAVRRALPLCVFHPRTEDGGFTALEQYRREWDDEKKAFKASHVHDWTSHPADAFRYLALAWRPAAPRKVIVPKQEGWRIPPPVELPQRRGW